MSAFDKIKELLVRIVKDDKFRTSVESQPTLEDRSQLLKESGYSFTQSEIDSASIKILELAEKGLFSDLDDCELVAVMGGYGGVLGLPSSIPQPQPFVAYGSFSKFFHKQPPYVDFVSPIDPHPSFAPKLLP
jgi:predicted ribosomally synthesized peptide with nif11-like leader